MEPTLATPRGGRVPWQDLLLAVSLLTLWNPPTTAQVTVESVPPSAAEGKDVLLRVHNLPRDTGRFNWFKGATTEENRRIVSYIVDAQKTIPGLAHSSRGTVYPNGFLLFQNITLNDTGVYTLQFINRTYDTEQVTGQLHVFPELPKPHITSNNSNPVENVDSVLLTCEPQTQNTSYLWSVSSKSRPASTRLELSLDNRTLTIHGVTRDDTGPYVCATRNPVSDGRSDPFTLNVLYGPDAPTISPSDSYYHPGANLNLSCHAASNPPAQYSWLINGRPQPYTQELFIPNIIANDSGSYTCLASNSATCLNKTTVKTITVSEPLAQPTLHASNTTLTEDDSVVLTCSTNNTGVSIGWLFNGQSLKVTERMTLSQDNSTFTIRPVRKEDAGNYQCEVSNSGDSRKSDPVRLAVKGDLTQSNSGLPPGAIAGIVVGVMAGVAVIAALVYFLFIRKTGGYDDLSSCSAFSKANCHAWEREKDFAPVSAPGSAPPFLLNPCFLALIPVDFFFMLPGPHSLLDTVIPICIWLRGGRSPYVFVSQSGKTRSQEETNEEMKGGAGESESRALWTVVGGRDRTGGEPKKRQKQPKASWTISKLRKKLPSTYRRGKVSESK